MRNREEGDIEMDNDKIRILANNLGLTQSQFLDVIFQKNMELNQADLQKRLDKLFLKKKNHKNTSEIIKYEIYDLFEKGNNYCLEFKNDINIFVSENGAGKTTILKLFISILEKDLQTINEIDFSKCKLSFVDSKSVEIDKNAINLEFANHYNECLDYLRGIISRRDFEILQDEFLQKGRFNTEKIEEELSSFLRENREVSYKINKARDFVKNLNNELQKKIGDLLEECVHIDTIFYPTYRRIETPKDKIFYSRYRNDIKVKNKYISFGMDDVHYRINAILEEIKISSNIAYVTITNDIINDLFKKDLTKLPETKKTIDKKKFDIIMDRIGRKSTKNYDDLLSYLDKQDDTKNIFLKYYINKLSAIYDKQEALTSRLKNFTNICNKYLENKEFVLNESELKMEIKIKNKKQSSLELEELSSGEKQIVSIFSKIYLDTSLPSVFVIDEPELSLSLKWQKDFLIDIYNSNKVSLLIATTHSPFIFEEGLIKYTKNINVCKKGE